MATTRLSRPQRRILIISFVHVDWAMTSVWTTRLCYIAGILLMVGPMVMVFTAACLPRSIAALAPLLARASPPGGVRPLHHLRGTDLGPPAVVVPPVLGGVLSHAPGGGRRLLSPIRPHPSRTQLPK
jgi:hypothetical protein